MTGRLTNAAVKSSKPVLVKTHGKHKTVKLPKVWNFGRFIEFKNTENKYNYRSLSYYKYNYNLSLKCLFPKTQQKRGDSSNICGHV
jgi:hypothetical protein